MGVTCDSPLASCCWRLLAAGAAAAACVLAFPEFGGGLLATASSPSASPQTKAAMLAMYSNYYNGLLQYFNFHNPNDQGLSRYWIAAEALDTVADGVELGAFGDPADAQNRLASLFVSQGRALVGGGWFSDYYDDMNWMSMSLEHAFTLTGTQKYLDKAEELMGLIMDAWDTSCCGPVQSLHGGIWWNKQHTQKATASNAGPVISATRLYMLTRNETYLAFATTAYDFWFAQMVDQATGQVCDHFTPDGKLHWQKFTYNEGLMIGAAVALYNATGLDMYRNHAYLVAQFMVRDETAGPNHVLTDGNDQRCQGDCMQFKGIACRQVAQLALLLQDKSFAALVASWARTIWSQALSSSGFFSTDWNGPAPSTPSGYVSSHSSATMCLAAADRIQHLL